MKPGSERIHACTWFATFLGQSLGEEIVCRSIVGIPTVHDSFSLLLQEKDFSGQVNRGTSTLKHVNVYSCSLRVAVWTRRAFRRHSKVKATSRLSVFSYGVPS